MIVTQKITVMTKVVTNMRKIVIGILIVCLYGFPFVYFAMHQDYANSSMLGYFIMIVVTSLLAFLGKFFSNSISPIVGNLLSLIISLYFIGEMTGNERWSSFFKPLTPYQLFIVVSILNLIPQFLAMMAATKIQSIKKQKLL